MPSYLITGCSRGLGLSLVQHIPKTENHIFATGRSSSPSPTLQQVIDASGGAVTYVELDVTSTSSIAAAVSTVSAAVGPTGLDVLINNAAITAVEAQTPLEMPALRAILDTNVICVQAVTAAFHPLLARGAGKKIVNVTSTVGSITLAHRLLAVPAPSYKISKAALNMLTAQWAMALEGQGWTVFGVSPGWLKTDLGGNGAMLPVEVGAKEVLRIVEESRPKDSGRFRDIQVPGSDGHYSGEDAPW